MIEHSIAIILIICCAAMDRCRGSKELKVISNFFEAFVMGLCLASLALMYTSYGADFYLAIVIFALLFAVCEWPGWGEPLGALLYKGNMRPGKLERWQVGPLKKNPVFALIVRGAIWTCPAVLMSPFYPELIYIFVAMSISMPVAVVAAREVGVRLHVQNTWQLQEIFRGALTGAVTYLMALGAA